VTFRLFALCIHFLEQCTEQDYKVDVVKIGLIQLMVRCCAPLRVFYGHNSVNRTHWLQIHLDGFVDHPLINCRDFIVSAIGWVFLSSECQQSDTHVLVLYTTYSFGVTGRQSSQNVCIFAYFSYTKCLKRTCRWPTHRPEIIHVYITVLPRLIHVVVEAHGQRGDMSC